MRQNGGAVGRISIVVRPVEQFLVVLKIALVPVLVVAAGIPTLFVLSKSPEVGWLTGIAILLIAMVSIVVLQTGPLKRRLEKSFAQIRRRVANACNHDIGAKHKDSRLACQMTAGVLRAPLFGYDEQKNAVMTLRNACNDPDQHGGFWFVEGGSGSGKTRTGLLLVQTLVRDHDLFELGSRCFLYDFASSSSAQDQLDRRLGSTRHDGAVVLVDNFQLVRAPVLRSLTQALVEHPGRPQERLIVFMSRSGHTWNIGPGSDVRLLSEAKAATRHVELNGPFVDEITNRVAQVDKNASDLLRALGSDGIASAVQLHLAQAIVRRKGASPEIEATLRLLTGTQDRVPDGLLRNLAIFSALSVHRGTFRRAEFRRANQDVERGGVGLGDFWRDASTLRKFSQVGLISKQTVGGTRFIFHESIAELCIDRLSGIREFRETLVAATQARLQSLRQIEDQLGEWLVSTEIGDKRRMEDNFDGAMGQGAYVRMTQSLRRADSRDGLSARSQTQLAILFDRIGEFQESRSRLGETVPDSLKPGDRLAAMLIAQRVETKHDEASQSGLPLLIDSDDRVFALIGEYWRRHIAAHRGTFDSAGLLEMATELLRNIEDSKEFWPIYSLARMHFDSLRQHYLSGGLPVCQIFSRDREALDGFLQDRLPTWKGLHVLYSQAHLTGHVLLPQLAIFGERIDRHVAARAGISESESRSIDDLVTAAGRQYQRARDEFWQYGDRESSYLQADVLNAEMIACDTDLDALVNRLQEYETFVNGTGFQDLKSYPNLYWFRWHVLKHYEGLMNLASGYSLPSDEHLDRAHHRLADVIRADDLANNAYGLLRARALGLLLDGVGQKLDVDALEALSRQASDHGYGFEARLMGHLAHSPGLTGAELRAVFRFYPFVHQ